MANRARSDGLRLLRSINDIQAHGQKDVKVDPPRATQEIGLDVGSKRYHDALEYLTDEEALIGDERTEIHTEEVEGPQPHAYAAYFFTGRAVELLEEPEGLSTTYDPDDPNAYPEAY